MGQRARFLFLVGVGFLKLLHHGVAATVHPWVNALRIDPDNRYLGALLAKLNLLDERKIKALSGLTLAYSALFLVEGTGLFFEKRLGRFPNDPDARSRLFRSRSMSCLKLPRS